MKSFSLCAILAASSWQVLCARAFDQPDNNPFADDAGAFPLGDPEPPAAPAKMPELLRPAYRKEADNQCASYKKNSLFCDADFARGLAREPGARTSGQWSPVRNKEKYSGDWNIVDHVWIAGDKQLKLDGGMKFHGLYNPLAAAWSPAEKKPLSFSMTVKFADNFNCGGGYVKLYEAQNGDPANFSGDTPYSIMFGPDRCGVTTRKVHFIVQYQPTEAGPRIEEHLLKKISIPENVRKSHQYGFTLYPDGRLEIMVDGEVADSGNLKQLTKPGWKSTETINDPEDKAPEDWKPLPKMIPDPKAEMPADWPIDEPEMIVDEEAEKPDDWHVDEPELVPNVDAKKPDGWDDAEDGEWVRPMVKNPKCANGCGPWKQPMIHNPKYKGIWKAPLIPNPDYVEEYPTRQIPNPHPFAIESPFEAIERFNTLGIEVWNVEGGTAFDNFFLSTEPEDMKKWAASTYKQLHSVESENFKRLLDANISSTTESSASEKAKAERSKRYVQIIAVVIVVCAVVAVAVRRLFGSTSFKKSDAPPVVAKTDAPTEADKAKENLDGAQAEPAVAAADAKETTKDGEEETEEPSAGETKPSKRL